MCVYVYTEHKQNILLACLCVRQPSYHLICRAAHVYFTPLIGSVCVGFLLFFYRAAICVLTSYDGLEITSIVA